MFFELKNFSRIFPKFFEQWRRIHGGVGAVRPGALKNHAPPLSLNSPLFPLLIQLSKYTTTNLYNLLSRPCIRKSETPSQIIRKGETP